MEALDKNTIKLTLKIIAKTIKEIIHTTLNKRSVKMENKKSSLEIFNYIAGISSMILAAVGLYYQINSNKVESNNTVVSVNNQVPVPAPIQAPVPVPAPVQIPASATVQTPSPPLNLPAPKHVEEQEDLTPTAHRNLALMMLSDTVPKNEADRRVNVRRKISENNENVQLRLRSLPAIKTLVNSGITQESVPSAVTAIQKAVILASDGQIPEEQVATIDNMVKPARGNRKEARSANDEGLRLMQANNFAGAVNYFNSALMHDPADVEVLGNLSYAYLKNGQLEESILISGYAVRVAPRRAGAWNQIAAAQAQRGANWLAVRAYVVLYALSGDQIKTKDFLTKTSLQDTDERIRNAAQLALLILTDPMPR